MSSEKFKIIFEYLAFAIFCIVLVFATLELTGKSKIFGFSQKQPLVLNQKVDFVHRVYISGAVEYPGVYEIKDGMLIVDIVKLAGDFSPDADIEKIHRDINLASRVFHQDHIYIPFKQKTLPEKLTQNNSITEIGKISLNQATQQELESLPGVGPATALKIIENRPYQSISDLLEVKGIGDATYDKLKDLVTI